MGCKNWQTILASLLSGRRSVTCSSVEAVEPEVPPGMPTMGPKREPPPADGPLRSDSMSRQLAIASGVILVAGAVLSIKAAMTDARSSFAPLLGAIPKSALIPKIELSVSRKLSQKFSAHDDGPESYFGLK